MNPNAEKLRKTVGVLDTLTCNGYDNHVYIVACINTLREVIADVEGGEADGDEHAQPESEKAKWN